MTVAYDGTGLVGWQRQATGDSVQGLLEAACAELNGDAVAVTGAGRTDAGVHATGQVASVTLTRDIDVRALVAAVNFRLPAAIRVLAAVEVSEAFHARFQARSKTYRYRIWNGSVLSPFERAYAWHVPAPVLDTAAMDAAARLLEGRHDFAAFQGAGSDTPTTERVVFSSRVRSEPPAVATDAALITYEVSGSGFLRYMVRSLVGTLVEIGWQRRPPDDIARLLIQPDRSAVGRTAPPRGLFLMKVEY